VEKLRGVHPSRHRKLSRVSVVEKLSEQIAFVYESYNRVMDATSRINELNQTVSTR
jgi:methyl-accepting chemotaxis protein